MESKTLYDWIALGLPVVSSLLVIWYTAKVDRQKAADEAKMKKESEDSAKREAELNKTLEDLRAELKEVKTELATLRSQVDEMKSYDSNVRHDVLVLTKYHERNWRYVAALGDLVSELAGGMRDRHLDGNITDALAKYRSFEKELLNDLAQEHDNGLLTAVNP